MNLSLDIIGLVDKYVQEIAKEHWKDDKCPPEFWVSLMGYNENQKIVLSVKHGERVFSKILFPVKDATYGYDAIKTEMEYLYNRTM